MREPTDDDHAGWVDVTAFIDDELRAFLTERAEISGRTLSEQLVYELQVNRDLTVPDAGDVVATQRGQVFRRMRSGSILQG